MKNIRLIALDMDGTLLLSDHHTVPARNIEAIRRAASLGIRVAINTGRMLEDASDFIRRLDLPCLIIAANGARASEGPVPECRMLYRCNIEAQDAQRALDILIPSGMMINGFEDGVVHTAGGEPGWKYHLVHRGLIEARYGEKTLREAADRGVMKIFAVADGFAGEAADPRVDALRAQLERELPQLQISSSAPGNIEITSPEAGKGQTLGRVAAHYGLSREQVMAVGDAGNDLDMLRYAPHSVAMGNASEDVKRICRYVTADNDACGVAQIIERVIDAVTEGEESHA